MMGITMVTHRSRALGALTLAAGMALSVAALAPISVAAQDATVTATTGELGTYLVGADGKTLYYFLKDTAPGVSVCDTDCQANWPLLTVPEGQAPVAGEGATGVLGAVPLGDGNSLVTYDGRPLYSFAGDAAAGDTNGNDVGEVWYVAQADGSVPEEDSEAAGEVGLTLATATGDALGTYLTGADGKTLYFFRVDGVPGVSMCDADCLTNWPAATVAEGQTVAGGDDIPGVIGMTTATDGTPIATYDGRPLYYFAGDAAAGDTNGQGLGDVWFVANVDGSMPAPAPAASAEPMASPAASPAS